MVRSVNFQFMDGLVNHMSSLIILDTTIVRYNRLIRMM